MQLKVTTDYGIRTILYLAKKGEIAASSEIAEQMKIPRKYLLNIIRHVKEAGLIETRKGAQGGYRLKRAPEDITLYDIICAMEGDIVLNRCLNADGFCSRDASEYCAVHTAYGEVQKKLIDSFKNINIKNLISR